MEKSKVNKVNIDTLLFLILTVALVTYRFYILQIFGFEYTDSDQSIMWLGAKNYARGLFHEPLFYGQSYNSMLEALLAVPLIKLSVPVYLALPTVTTSLALFPFILLSTLTFFKYSRTTAILILCIPFMLPVAYDCITTLSRGFVTGIAIVSIGLFSIFNPNSYRLIMLTGFSAVTGFLINGNSALLSAPLILYLLIINIKNKEFYLYLFTGIIAGIITILTILSFYWSNPDYVLHTFPTKFSIQYMFDAFEDLDKFFNNVTPIFWNSGWLILPILLLIAFVLYKQNLNKAALIAIAMPIILILPFTYLKVHDGTNSIFFSYSRMYLAIPVILTLLLSFVKFNNRFLIYCTVAIALFFCCYKMITAKGSIESHLKGYHIVSIIKNSKLKDKCEQINRITSNHDADLVILKDHNHSDLYNYGCPALIDSFPNTLKPAYERRTWRLIEDKGKVYENVLIIDYTNELIRKYRFVEPVEALSGCYIIKNNDLTTLKLMQKLNLDIRDF